MPIDPFLAPPRLLDVAQAAHRLGFTQRKVWSLIAAGQLAAIRIDARWRIDPVDLETYIAARRVAARRETRRQDDASAAMAREEDVALPFASVSRG